MQEVPQQCTIKETIVAPSRIHFLRFVLEAYEGIALVTTIDPGLGLVKLSIAPGCEKDVDLILESEADHLNLRRLWMEET